ncbi:hypothetical protein B0T16DRAFT_402854 [Cercophora newfieldiana]|uniref:Apple domain-containing protein n=1 Tax=Cercophora newfieldiana TaxID=92897 RepID=A0AA40D2M5_9PEZI|nr:hypothetical protein B0T16DRAFT_402854 [Cercophora newfieldiana]
MVRIAALAAAALSLLPTALGTYHPDIIRPPPLGPYLNYPDRHGSCAHRALAYLTCYYPSSPECRQDLAIQAASFCSSYLSQTATVFNTATVVSTATSIATETLTSEATVTSTSTSVTKTTTTEVSSITSISTSTLTLPTSYITPPPTSVVALDRRSPESSTCPSLHAKRLTRRPPAKLSSVCSCLGIHATTETTTSTLTTSTATTTSTTTTTTTTSTSTATLIEVSTSITTTTTSTTTTSGTIATSTPIVDYCDLTYKGGGVTPGNTVIQPPGDFDGRQCCILCWSTANCVASATGLGFCQLLIKTSVLEGAPTDAQCPLGVESYVYLDGPGSLYRGPCSPRLG